ncbi:MAG TPA: 50S ribosomal protein L9 [Candidatus Paceibacterota bacterium]|nr:50S ribosomal protein L9 [Candidatus Paceibacterota bacterium]HMP18729.1 50S ribosomal protein L9 [Candidatus Paceibacterota bacterium]HMP85264.1 50S ribosomal protein L9 [Candidatus Paceibacterota bacterium]
MKVILLQNIAGLGQKDDIKDVSEGYAMNMLIPRKMAKFASSGDIKQIQNTKNKKLKNSELLQNKVHKLLNQIDGKNIIINAKSNDKGHLFAQIHAKEIADSIGELGFDISEDWVVLEKPIKEIGKFSIKISAYKKSITVKLEIK